MKVSVIIKALNEERNITRAIESALLAINKVGGEVILADSLSTDQTVELASRYPLRIVQLVNPQDRCCGVGAEIGYRVAHGEYIYILDADMELDGDFLVAAVAALDADTSLAGIGGTLKDLYVVNAEFRRRAEDIAAVEIGEVDCLNGGGLFRKTAIEQVGYLTNRNLHSYEEYELGLRLRANGWHLQRINLQAVKHYGHTDTSFRLLWRRWRGRYAWGAGELLREAWGKPYLREAIKGVAQYRLSIIVLGWWLSLLLGAIGGYYHPSGWWIFFVLLLVPLIFGVIRRKSLMDGLYMVVSQNLHTAGVITGFFSARRGDPDQPPEFRTIK